jgi:hypothetical protein
MQVGLSISKSLRSRPDPEGDRVAVAEAKSRPIGPWCWPAQGFTVSARKHYLLHRKHYLLRYKHCSSRCFALRARPCTSVHARWL